MKIPRAKPRRRHIILATTVSMRRIQVLLLAFLAPGGILSFPVGIRSFHLHQSSGAIARSKAARQIHLSRHLDDDALPDREKPQNIIINPIYASLAAAETIYWYYLAPGIDPASRWFAPSDGELISQLLNPAIIFNEPGFAFSSLLLNSFLILPMVWALLLLQEEGDDQVISPLPFCLAGFFVGGGSLIPYMIVRRRSTTVDLDQNRYGGLLRLFEPDSVGPKLISMLLVLVWISFAYEVSGSSLQFEWEAFVDRLHHSQFTSLALFDFTMLSCTIVEPMTDDARRRKYFGDQGDVKKLWGFLLPLFGPVAWILKRPALNVT